MMVTVLVIRLRCHCKILQDMEKLVDQGLVRSVGLSNFNQEQIERLLSTPGLKYKPAAMEVGIRTD